jgi:primosomal protein N' (replication factor Y) (superfamily II helicase)
MNSSAINFARVIIASPLAQPLIYAVPDEFRERIAIGMRALIPLKKRKLTGIVLELLEDSSVIQAKPILALPDESAVVDQTLLALSRWIAQYYVCTLGEVLAVILPPALRRESVREIVLLPDAAAADAVEAEILSLLRQKQRWLTVKALTRRFSSTSACKALERLHARGAVAIRERIPGARRRRRDSHPEVPAQQCASDTAFVLTPAQESALAAITERRHRGGFEVFLLYGVTGSGKTEVYLRAVEQARQAGHQSLILVPEISLTPQLLDRVATRFPGRVGVLHSGLTPAERWSQWWRTARGEVDVLIGARSAVFAPLPRLGLIIVDEEHDPSYKQEDGLRYNGRDVAVVRGKYLACPVILGSATPAIESFENARQGRYRLLEMPERVQARPLPAIEVIDLRVKGKNADNSNSGAHRLISRELADAVIENHAKSRQSLIFLNRRGFANFLQCRLCGHLLRCAYCSVTLTLHLQQESLCCHHCNFRRNLTDICPACGEPGLAPIGAGTEQIEHALRRLLSGARIARMDRDTTAARGSHEALIRRWEKGEIDVLLGTQMITKGHDVGGVTLVGALLADMSLNLPDFRAAERTFQLLSQVAGRAGRGRDPGRVVVQTFAPDHYAMRHLLRHDYSGFFAEEIEFRRALNYPPFCRLACLRVDGLKADAVETGARSLARGLRAQLARNEKLRDQIEILGPAPAPILKLRSRYRWQLLLKSRHSAALLELATSARRLAPRSPAWRLYIDVDPYSML